MNVDQMFAGMNNAPMFGKGSFMGAGLYRVKSKIIKLHEGFKGKSFIFEFEIITSSNPKHAVGSTGSWVVKLGAQNANAFSDMKSLAFALLGIDPKTVKKPEEDPSAHAFATDSLKAQCDATYAAANSLDADALIGIEVDLEAVMVKTKAGGDFTRHNWAPTPENAAAYAEATAA